MGRAAASVNARRARLRDRLQATAAALADGGARSPRGAIIRLEAPGLDFAETATAGLARADGRPMTADCAYHVASIGKLMTTALVLQLAEAGRFGPGGIDAPLGDLGLLEDSLLSRLHTRGGTVLGYGITLRQLLTHTAGLGDAFADDASGTADDLGGPAPESLGPALWRSLKARREGTVRDDDLCARRWAVWDSARPDDPEAGLLNRYLAQLGAAPPFLPGERFHYSDQGFTLLALLVERSAGRPYAELQDQRIFMPLGLTGSWMHGRQSPPGDLADRECDVWMNGVSLQGVGANLSFDFGGGGQVMTAEDQIRFLNALLTGRLFDRPGTLAALTDWTTPPGLQAPRTAIGLGVQRWAIPDGSAQMTGHAGAWGAQLWRDPRTGATLAGTVNQRHDGAWAFALLEDVHSIQEGEP